MKVPLFFHAHKLRLLNTSLKFSVSFLLPYPLRRTSSFCSGDNFARTHPHTALMCATRQSCGNPYQSSTHLYLSLQAIISLHCQNTPAQTADFPYNYSNLSRCEGRLLRVAKKLLHIATEVLHFISKLLFGTSDPSVQLY